MTEYQITRRENRRRHSFRLTTKVLGRKHFVDDGPENFSHMKKLCIVC